MKRESYTSPKKIIFQMKSESYISPEKTIFQTKNFLCLREKLIFYACAKSLIFCSVSNTALLFFILAKLKRVFKRVI